MNYKREEIISNFYETSKTQRGVPLLSKKAESKEVYDLDSLKDKFCETYRHSDKLKSCDAYYYDQYNHIIVEFKNTHHLQLKEYYDEIEVKLLDTHMICRETFWKSKKLKDISRVQVIVVYNDSLHNGNGLQGICKALNEMTPLQGDKKRTTNSPKQFSDEIEYQNAVGRTKSKYEKSFYEEIQFLEKQDFEDRYINTTDYSKLEKWSELS